MKKIILALIFLQVSTFLMAQTNPSTISSRPNNDTDPYFNYSLLKDFLLLQKNNPGIFSTGIKPQWNSKLYQDQYQQALAINKKKEFYPVIIPDSRFISHAMPTHYGSQNYMWVSTQPEYRNLGEQIASDVVEGVVGGVVGGLLSGKKHKYTFTNNKKGYYTPSGLKF